MDVSIILVNYNTTRLLLQAIDSIYEKSAGFTFEVIVVEITLLKIRRKKFEKNMGIKLRSFRYLKI